MKKLTLGTLGEWSEDALGGILIMAIIYLLLLF